MLLSKKIMNKLGNLSRILAVVLVVVVLQLAYIGYLIVATSVVIRNPKLEHYHFRMQIIAHGLPQNFGSKEYQIGYAKDQCGIDLPEQPIHFHDDKDQMVHIHWDGITGGMVMKYYGWNYIGGAPGALGYQLRGIKIPKKVPIHGSVLPKLPSDVKFFIYTGDESGYQKRSFDDWKIQDLEKFFNKSSNLPGNKTSFWDKLFPKASAHGTANDADGDDGTETPDEKLTRINNLLGNVVIFAQKDEPSEKQIKERFNKLEPLSNSTCGG